MSIEVLMLGWEFPPFISGGLGTACYGLTHAMKNLDVNIVMLLPTSTWGIEGQTHTFLELESSLSENPEHITFKPVPSKIPNPYLNSRTPPLRIGCAGAVGGYDGNLVERVNEYAQCCTKLMKGQSFDVIHAHDWVTYPAGIALSEKFSKPLIVHVHATEVDRSGSSVNKKIFNIEREGMEAATLLIAVSEYTADIIVRNYEITREKIKVVHNGAISRSFTQKHQVYKNGEK